jgi:hypothetical protein
LRNGGLIDQLGPGSGCGKTSREAKAYLRR